MKPTLIVFSSRMALPVANGIRDNLLEAFEVDIWAEGFFDEKNTIPLWVFLKKLMCYDCAAVVLGDDDIRRKEGKGEEESVPRDNVIFELGATMARLGPQKTFIFAPKDRQVTLPTYFKGVLLLEYLSSPDARGNYQGATGSSCAEVKRKIATLSEDAFHSDLPAQGLAVGYFLNFIERLYRGLREDQVLDLPETRIWRSDCGFTVTTFVPSEAVTRESADRMLKEMGARNVLAKLFRDRDMSVYALPRLKDSEPLHILDIPTTLLTSEKIINTIDSFWGNFGDSWFQKQLQRREQLSFARKLRAMRIESAFDERIVFVEPLLSWPSHVEALGKMTPPKL